MSHRSLRPKHATVVAYLALSVALGGTGYAATALPRNSVTSATIRDRSVKLRDLAPSIRPLRVPGAKGDPGASVTGPQGASGVSLTGAQGAAGTAGASGAAGSAGADGLDGTEGAAGSTGAKGDQGQQGLPGSIRAYGHIRPDGSGSVQGVTVTHPGLGLYCVNGVASGITAIVANPDAHSSTAHVVQPNQPATNPCGPDRFLVQITNQNGADTGAWIVGS